MNPVAPVNRTFFTCRKDVGQYKNQSVRKRLHLRWELSDHEQSGVSLLSKIVSQTVTSCQWVLDSPMVFQIVSTSFFQNEFGSCSCSSVSRKVELVVVVTFKVVIEEAESNCII